MKIHRLRITGDIFVEVRTEKGLILGTSILKGSFEEEAEPWIEEAFEKYLLRKGDPDVDLLLLKREGVSGDLWRVYERLKEIAPFGRTITYSELARLTGKHPRFIGYAMKVNPFPILIPCHRVVSSKGIGGFSFGREVKLALLKFEGAYPLRNP